MRRRMSSALLLCLVLSSPFQGWARGGPLQADLQAGSETLGAIVLGQKIQLMMRDGTYLEGKVLRASPGELNVHVSKHEPKGSWSGSDKTIPTGEIAVIHMRKNGSVAVPVALGVAAGLLGAIGAAYAADDVHSDSGYFAMFIAAAAGGATGGALLGREIARKTITIQVVPAKRAMDTKPAETRATHPKNPGQRTVPY